MVLESEKLSVVVPVYNVYPYLRECLDSIINQTYKNLEIIIINDASPYKEDDEICREYAAKDERIKYIVHEENKKQGGARNTGIKNATGKYITFIDSDDYLYDMNTYSECINIFDKNKVNIVFFNYILLYKEEFKKNSFINLSHFNKSIKLNENYFMNDPHAVTKLFLLDDLINNKLYFKENTKFEDLNFWFKIQVVLQPIIYGVNKEYYVYRQQNESTMNNIERYLTDYIIIFEDMYDYIKEKKQWNKIYIKYLSHLKNIEYNINKLDNKTNKYLSENIIKILEKINITEEEFINNLGFDFYKVLFGNKYIYNMFSETENKIKNKKYMFIKENIIIFKIKREMKRITKQIKNIFIKDK